MKRWILGQRDEDTEDRMNRYKYVSSMEYLRAEHLKPNKKKCSDQLEQRARQRAERLNCMKIKTKKQM